MNWRSTASVTIGIVSGNGNFTARYTLAIANAASSIDFTSTLRRSAHRSMLSSNKCRASPYTSPT